MLQTNIKNVYSLKTISMVLLLKQLNSSGRGHIIIYIT